MNQKLHTLLTILVSLVFLAIFYHILVMYVTPMEDISLDLSLSSKEDALVIDPEDYDPKGWTVYTKEADVMTELEPDYYGGYKGLKSGQTFYFSRIMDEELDSPTLQITPVNRTFSIWLDDVLLYTDCPDLDNRIGYLTLPMNDWDRLDSITLSLPMDYQGKTLTIAQSFPDYFYLETSSITAFPASVMLYCGFAYESELISESFSTSILAGLAFLIGAILLIVFVRNRDWGILGLSLLPFLWMTSQLINTSFYWEYYGSFDNEIAIIIPLIAAGGLFLFLSTRTRKYPVIIWGLTISYFLSVAACAVILGNFSSIKCTNQIATFIISYLPFWLGFFYIVVLLLLSAISLRKENRFYRIFTPLAFLGIAFFWTALFVYYGKDTVGSLISASLKSGQITYIYYRILPAISLTAIITAIADAIKNEHHNRIEKRLIQEQQDLAHTTYENMRHQHEEIMKIRHDMLGHFEILKELSSEEKVTSYLEELIGQNKKVRPILYTGNEILTIILNGKLSAAEDAGIHVKISRSIAPEKLPITDADFCSLIINMMNNAIRAASNSGAAEPFIHLDFHVKDSWFNIICENSADIKQIKTNIKKETVPKHGLGIKIMKDITNRYEGLFDTEYGNDYYKVNIILPLD